MCSKFFLLIKKQFSTFCKKKNHEITDSAKNMCTEPQLMKIFYLAHIVPENSINQKYIKHCETCLYDTTTKFLMPEKINTLILIVSQFLLILKH